MKTEGEGNLAVTSVVTIGTFDGVHLGHQTLIGTVIERARQRRAQSVVVTFEPVPVSVLRPDRYRGRISTPEEKIDLLERSGVDRVEVIRFDRALASKSPEEFLQMLADQLGMAELWVGNDFALGRDRAGTLEVITQIGHRLGFETFTVERVTAGEQPISSTSIRMSIEEGDVARANLLLGRPFQVSGVVIHGAHLGRKIGFPTANFVPPQGVVQLADGIYASLSTIPGELEHRPAMTYIGTRPTVDGGDRQVETNILDFDGDLYSKTLTVELIERVRGDQTFDGLQPLIDQLKQDEIDIRRILATPADPRLWL